MGFRVRAVNTASDSENKIHDDAVAAAYGFRRALVPGVTVYGYLAATAVEHFGPEWLERGAMDVRFHQPVYEGDEVDVTVTPEGDGRVRIEAGQCAAGTAWIGEHRPSYADDGPRPVERRKPSAETLAVGTVLGALLQRPVATESRMSAPLDFSVGGRAHPAALLALANRIFVENYELGPWIHVSSEVRKFRPARIDESVDVHAKIVEQYERKGHEFVVLDVLISGAGPIEQVRHTAIWRPRITR
ncbi:MAG: MaoC family dehydratase [Acidobacteriia bacterium]|nr:MaoC family dehydratase [Terriglobia bacterium]